MPTVTKSTDAQTPRPFSIETNSSLDAQRDVRARLARISPSHRLRLLASLITETSLLIERAEDVERIPSTPIEKPKFGVALTARQRAILDFIRGYITENGFPPALRDIARAFGIRSTNGVTDHLEALERKGFIERAAMKGRGIRLVEKGAE